MRIADLLYQVIPHRWFIHLSRQYYKLLKKLYKPMDEKQFRYLLETKLGVGKGDTVAVHSSVNKLNINFSVYKLLEILLETVGEEGTLLFPSWHYVGRAEVHLRKPDFVFNVKNSPTMLGLLNELARRHPNAHRSCHPIAAMCAIGKHAQELLATHHLDIYPCGKESPWYKILKYKPKIIGIGEKVVSLSFVHCVEESQYEQFPVKTLSEETLGGRVILEDGKEITVQTLYNNGKVRKKDFVRFVKQHISRQSCKMFQYKSMNFFTCNPVLFLEEMTELANKNITVYK
jgi:aminoglycoside 3-N-acetyltransferase